MALFRPRQNGASSMPAVGLGPMPLHDTMREGVHSFAGGAVVAHPVQEIERTWEDLAWGRKKVALDNVYGQHMAIRLQMENHVFSQHERGLPGFARRSLGLETLRNRDESIQFADYLGDGYDGVEELDWRLAMERNLGVAMPAS